MEINKTNEIDVIALVKKLLSNKKSLCISTGISAIIGIIVALNTPKQYTSTVVLAPEISSSSIGLSSSLSEMASNFGINLDSKTSMDAIYPDIYPEIFASNEFIKNLFDIKIRTIDNSTERTLKEHLTKEAKIPFWNIPGVWIKKLFTKKDKTVPSKDGDNFILTKDEENLIGIISSNISCLIDSKTGVITISATDNDALAAAIISDTLQNRLQDYITTYRTQKAKKDLQYYKKLFIESKKEYIEAQHKYAGYSDANEDPLLQSYKTKEEQYENEMQLKYNAYAQWASQLQAAKAKVQERTPAFTIIQKPTTSNKASSTPRIFIVIIYTCIGIAIDAIWVLILKDRKKIK